MAQYAPQNPSIVSTTINATTFRSASRISARAGTLFSSGRIHFVPNDVCCKWNGNSHNLKSFFIGKQNRDCPARYHCRQFNDRGGHCCFGQGFNFIFFPTISMHFQQQFRAFWTTSRSQMSGGVLGTASPSISTSYYYVNLFSEQMHTGQ